MTDTSIKLNDEFDSPEVSWRLDESEQAQSVVDGVYIIGRALGPFFLVDGESRNKRFYSKNLWEKAINESKSYIDSGGMVGTIGHEQVLDDKAFLEGKVSHKVSKIWIDESNKVGMGEVLLLNTNAGKLLETYMRAGVQIAVSSRAFGELRGKTKSGASIVDPSTFKLESFDFVRNPGVTIATPKLVESQDNSESQSYLESINSEEVIMNDQILESIAKDKALLQTQLSEALDKINSLSAEITNIKTSQETDKLNSKIEALTEKLNEYSKLGSQSDLLSAITENTQLKDKLSSVITETTQLKDELAKYKSLGTQSELTELVSVVENYTKIGSVDSIKKSLEEAAEKIASLSESTNNSELNLLKTYKTLGSPEELSGMIDLTSRYMEACDIDEVDTMIHLLDKYSDLGSPSEISEMMDLIEAANNCGKLGEHFNMNESAKIYEDLGTPEELSKIVEIAEQYSNLGSIETITEALRVVKTYGRLGTPQKIAETLALVEAYSDLGTIDELTQVTDLVENYLELGTPDELSTVLDAADQYGELGTPEELTQIAESLDSYIELGSPADISKVLDLAEEMLSNHGTLDDIVELENVTEDYLKLGSIEELSKALDTLEEYSNLGSVDDIKTAFDITESMVKKSNEAKLKSEASEIADKYGIKCQVVEELITKIGKSEAIKTLDEMLEARDFTSRYRNTSAKSESNLNESADDTTQLSKSRISRLFTTLSR